MRRYRDVNRQRFAFPAVQPYLLVNEAYKVLHPVQNGFNLELNG